MEPHDYYQVSLKLILKNDKGEILALKAVDNGSMAGFFDLPGGRIHKDEFRADFADILRRETKEEIGDIEFSVNPKVVAVSRHLIPARFSATKQDVHVLYLFFEGQYSGGEIRISHEQSG